MRPLKGIRGRWLVASGLAALAAVVAAGLRPPQADVAWPLYLADEVLHGARLGVDFIEVNPPLFVWLAIPPVMLAHATGLSSWVAAVCCGAVLIGVSTWITFRALRLAGMPEGSLGPALAGTLFALTVLPSWEFLQREHLALALTLPWLAVSAARLAGGGVDRSDARAAGVLGALGLAFKPHFLIPGLLVEAVVVRRAGLRTAARWPEQVAIPAVGAAYLVLVLLLAPDYIPSVLPLREAYQRYLHNNLIYNIGPTPWVLLPAFGLAGYAAARVRNRRSTPLQDLLAAAVVGFWAAAIAQGKGLPYHYLTATGYGFLLMGSVALGSSATEPGGRWPSRLVLACARVSSVAGPAIMTGWLLGTAGRARPPYLADGFEELTRFLQPDAAGQPLVVLSSNLTAAWPLTSTVGARWGLRYVSLWMLGAYYYDELWRQSGVVAHRPLPNRTGAELRFSRAVVEDLVDTRPRYLVVLLPDPTVLQWGGATRIDYLGYFSSDSAFAGLLREYDDLGVVSRYRVFRRR